MSVGKIKEFDMENGNWTLYCDRIEMYFKANGIKDELKLPTLISLVGDSVYELMVNLANPKKPTELSYSELITLVREHLQPKPSILAERYRFRQRRQETGESITQYIAELKKMSRDCEFGAQLIDNLRDQFVCGISSDLIRQRLFSEQNVTFPQAIRLAKSLEAAERDSAVVDSGQPAAGAGALHSLAVASSRRPAARSAAAPVRAAAAGSCDACGDAHDSEGCRYKNFVCALCKNKGHLRRVCPYKNPGGTSSSSRSFPSGRKGQWRRGQSTHFVSQTTADDSSGSEEEVEEPIFQMSIGDYKPVSVTLSVNGLDLTMEIDTGSACSCINRATYESLFSKCKLEKSNVVFRFYDGTKIKPMGMFKTTVEYNNCKKVLYLYVIDKGVTSLIGRQWLTELNVNIPLFTSSNHKMSHPTECKELHVILDRHKEVFNGGLGRYTGGCASLRVREGAQPVFCRARPVPYALRDRADAELDAMLRSGVIEPVDCSDWASPLVLVNKGDGSLRVCADYKVTLNPVLLVDRYPLPRVEDLLSNLAGGEEFSKIDLSQAYNQICLTDDSKKYTVINTHRGLFKYNRLVYGLSSSSGIFQRIMSDIVRDIPNVQCFCDDIICTGPDRASHLSSLERLLSKLESVGLKIKRSKCSFLAKEVKYLGFIVDKNGIRPDPEKIAAIKDMPAPKNISELRSFLGMVNFYARFVPKLSDILHPLHVLLGKGVQWNWDKRKSEAFENIKKLMLSSKVLAHYDPKKQLVLTCDASARGIGGVLSQRDTSGEERAVAYVSRKLTKAEQNYSQIHREALAIVYCVNKFHQYLYGRRFNLKTDHKPLVSIFGPHKGIPTMAASRMQRWAIILSAYEFDIEYVGTHSNGADVLSRLPIGGDTSHEPPEQTYLHFAAGAMLMDCNKIRKETARDPWLSRVRSYIENGWPEHAEIKQLEPYFNRKTELYLELDCVMWGHRLVVPETCRAWVLNELHESHMGMVKTKAFARSYVWWPGIDEAIETQCRACETCAALAPAPPAAPPVPWQWPHRPYERVHIDFLGPIDGSTYLVTVDARSKWIEVFKMGRTTAGATASRLRESWSRWGLPRQVVSDNGPPFTSNEFKEFLEKNGIEQILTAPYHPSSNGAAESAVKIIKNVIKKARRDRIDVDVAIQRFLLVYHNTPHSSTGESPAKLLQGRKLRTRLDVLKPEHGHKRKAQNHTKSPKLLNPGETIWYRNFGLGPNWSKGEIMDRLGKSNYVVKACDGSAAHRHVDQIKRRSRSSCVFTDSNTEGVDSVEQPTGSVSNESLESLASGEETKVADRNQTASITAPGNSSVKSPNKNTSEAPSALPVGTVSTDNNEVSKRLRNPVIRYGFEID